MKIAPACKRNSAVGCKNKYAAAAFGATNYLFRCRRSQPSYIESGRLESLDRASGIGIIIFTHVMPKTRPHPKLQSLSEQGCLNPHPESVTDELFAGNEFFDARDMVQVKYEMLRRVEKDGSSISEAAMSFGFSRPTFYQAQAAFEASGVAGLVPRKRGPREAHKLTADVIEFIEQSRGENPSLKTRELVSRVRERFDVVVHPRSIERALARTQKKR